MAGGRVKKRLAAKAAQPTSTAARAITPPPASQRSLNRAAATSSSSFNGFRLCRRRYLPVFLLLLLFLCLPAASYFVPRSPSGVPSPPELYTFEVVNEYPHDPRAFTQGLVYGGDDVLYESTGLYGELGMFTHQMKDGWWLTTDGKVIFGSDGTSILYQIDPETLKGNSS